MKKKVLALFVIICMLLSNTVLLIPSISAASQGSCGENLTWYRDYETDTLIIEGTGDMDSFAPRGYISLSDIPWSAFRDFYHAIEVREGVTSVGDAAFYDMNNVTHVSLPDGLAYIGNHSFYSCDKIRHVDLPSSVTYIGEYAFEHCFDLKEIVLPFHTDYVGKFAFHNCVDLESVVIENPQCYIDSAQETLGISDETVIYGHPGSTAESYAQKNGYNFKSIDSYEHKTGYNAENYPSSINVLVNNRAIWLDKTASFASYEPTQIGFIDFEGDGIPELFINQCCGSGLISYNLFFKIDDTGAQVYEIQNTLANSICEPNLGDSRTQMMREKSTGRYVYLCYGYSRSGVNYSNSFNYFLCLNASGQTDYTPLWSTSREYDTTTFSYEEDGTTFVVDEEMWNSHQTEVLSNYEPVGVQIKCVDHSILQACNDHELAEALMEMYEIFYSQADLAPYAGEIFESSGKNEDDTQTPSTTYEKSFNEFFVENKEVNIDALVNYDSVAAAVCAESSSIEIYWNTYLSALSDSEFLSVDNIGDASVSPLKMHHYYEAALLEAIMQTKLDDDYLAAIGERAVKIAIEAVSFCVQYNSEFESREDVLNRKLKEETRDLDRDGEEIIRIYEYYGSKCKNLQNYDIVKSIYDLCVEAEATVEEFHQALSNYVEVNQVSDEILVALEFLKGQLELSNNKEDKIILTAVENVITSLTISCDTHLVLGVLEPMQDQIWNVMIGVAEDLLGEYFLVAKAAKMCIDGGLLLMDVLFPTTMSSKSYCKLYADYAIESVVQEAIYAAYDEYSISPRKETADAIVGLYEVLAYTYQHEIQVGNVLVKQLHKDGMLNGLRNLISSSNMEDYRYEKACIQAYDAYLAEITKVKAEAQREYGIAIGELQPVYIVYFINGKALLFEEFTTETGVPYIAPVERAEKVANALGFRADVMGVYSDSTMTKAYDDTVPVSGPVTLFMDVGLFNKKNGTPVLMDMSSDVSVTKNGLPSNTKLNVSYETEGTAYDMAATNFDGMHFEIYDISLSNQSVDVQPSEAVTVSIPLKEGYEKQDVSVYYMNPNGNFRNMRATVENGYCCFTTTHFSKYVIVYGVSEADVLNNLKFPIIISVSVIIALIALVLVVFARKKKRKS